VRTDFLLYLLLIFIDSMRGVIVVPILFVLNHAQEEPLWVSFSIPCGKPGEGEIEGANPLEEDFNHNALITRGLGNVGAVYRLGTKEGYCMYRSGSVIGTWLLRDDDDFSRLESKGGSPNMEERLCAWIHMMRGRVCGAQNGEIDVKDALTLDNEGCATSLWNNGEFTVCKDGLVKLKPGNRRGCDQIVLVTDSKFENTQQIAWEFPLSLSRDVACIKSYEPYVGPTGSRTVSSMVVKDDAFACLHNDRTFALYSLPRQKDVSEVNEDAKIKADQICFRVMEYVKSEAVLEKLVFRDIDIPC
jgi:hypothetical protein